MKIGHQTYTLRGFRQLIIFITSLIHHNSIHRFSNSSRKSKAGINALYGSVPVGSESTIPSKFH